MANLTDFYMHKKPMNMTEEEKEVIVAFFGDLQTFESNPIRQKLEK